ncbi:hypothetical protein Hanom_Chr06g00489791 [Helianthus anomalus]
MVDLTEESDWDVRDDRAVSVLRVFRVWFEGLKGVKKVLEMAGRDDGAAMGVEGRRWLLYGG